MDNKDLIITGALDGSNLEKSISDLVKTVEQKTNQMAKSFDDAMQKMGNSMQGIAASNNAIINGINAQIAANNKLIESINSISDAENKRNKKSKKEVSKEEVFGMPIDTEQAIDAKLKALGNLRKITAISSENYDAIKNEYSKLNKLKKELLKTAEERKRDAEKEAQKEAEKHTKEESKREKERLREHEEIQRKIAKANKERQKEYEATSKRIAKAEQEKQKEREKIVAEAIRKKKEAAEKELQKEKEITAEQKKRNASQKARGTRVADSVLGMHERSVTEMEEKIRLLKKHQEYLSNRGLLSQPKINQMTRAIDRLQAKISKINTETKAQNAQPFDVFKMPENTVAEISAKMKAISMLRENAKIGSRELDRLNNEYNRLNISQKKALSSGVKLENQNNKLIKTFKNLSERVAFYFGLGALTGFVRNLIEVRAEYEMIERSIGVLVDDMDKGSQVFRTLQDKAKESPFTLIELGTATKQLAAYDFQTKDLVNTTNRLADISSALNVPIERLVYNLGQIKAQNVLNARDARDFANAGLAIVPMLAKMYSEQEKNMVTAADVYDRMKKKMVSYKDVLSVINQVTDEGGKFYDFQAKQAETLKVKIANLSLAYNDMLNEIGKDNNSIFDIYINGAKSLFENWKKVANVAKYFLVTLSSYKVYQIINNRIIQEQGRLLTSNSVKLSKMNTAAVMFGRTLKSVALSLKGFLLNPATLLSFGLMALFDVIGKIEEAKAKIEELTNGIREKVIENVKKISDFITDNKDNIKLIGSDNLSTETAEHLWEGYKEQLKSATEEGEKLVFTLESIEDINKRLIESRKILESIIQADKTIDNLTEHITYNTGGLISDSLEDELLLLKKLKKNYDEILEKKDKGLVSDSVVKGRAKSVEYQMNVVKHNAEEFSQSIVDIIKENGDKSPQAVNEILTKIKGVFLKNNESIRGEAAKMFNIIVDEQVKTMLNLDKEWSNILKTNESLSDAFLEKLRKHEHVMTSVKKIQLDTTRSYKDLPEDAKEAFERTLNEFIQELPNSEQEIRNIINNWDEFKIKIGFAFNIEEPSRLQKYFNKMLLKVPFSVDKKIYSELEKLTPKEGEDNFEYAKRLREGWLQTKKEIEELKRQNKGTATVGLYDNEISALEDKAKAYKLASKGMGVALETEQKQKQKARREETLLSKAIKNEIQLIDNLNSSYDKLNKAGEKRSTILKTLSNLYSKQVTAINNILTAHGLPKFNIEDFAGKDVKAQLEYFEKLRDIMIKKGLDVKEMDAFKQLGKKLMGLTVDSNVDNIRDKMRAISKVIQDVGKEVGFKKELDKDEEMQTFFHMIGVDIKDLPQTADEAIQRIQDAINAAGVKNFDILNTDINKFAKENDFDENSEWFKTLKDAIEKARSLYKDEFVQRVQYLNDYIEKYGTAQEQIYKITKHYDYLIEHSRDEYQKKSLKEEKQKRISEAKMREITKGIDWDVAIPELGGILRKVAKKVLDNLKTYMDSAEFKALPATDKKAWYDLKGKLNKTTGGDSNNPFNFAIWGKIADQMKEWENSIQEVTYAEQKHKEALELLENAETEGQKEYAEKLVSTTEEAVKEAKNKANKSQKDLTESSNKATNGIKNFGNTINEITNGSLYGLVNGFTKLITKLTGGKDSVAKSLEEVGGKIGGIIGAVLQIIDILGENSKEKIEQWIDAIGNTIENVIRNLPAIFAGVVKGAWNAVGGIFNGIGHWFGIDFQDMFNGGNTRKVAEQTRELTKSNERLQKSIEYLSDVMSDSAGVKAINAYEKAAEAQLKINENKKDIWIAQMNRHGAHHSNAYYFNDEYFSQWADDIKKALETAGLTGKNVASWADVQNLTAEELAAIRAFAPEAFRYLEEVGEYDVSKYLNEYTDLAGEIKKLEEKIKENLTQTSFKSLRESFLSELVEMKKDAKEFGEDFQKLLFKSMVNKFVLDDEFDAELKKIYDEWADKLKNGSADDLKNFRQLIEELFAEKKAEADALANGLGYKGEDKLNLSALQQGIQSITEETGGAIEAYLNGISAQVYLHNDKLQELINLSQVNTGSKSEIIQIMKNGLESLNTIKRTILDCLSPNSRAFKVELIN